MSRISINYRRLETPAILGILPRLSRSELAAIAQAAIDQLDQKEGDADFEICREENEPIFRDRIQATEIGCSIAEPDYCEAKDDAGTLRQSEA